MKVKKVIKMKVKNRKTKKKIRPLTRSNVKVLSKFKKRTKVKMADPFSQSNRDKFFENLINVETTAEVLGVAPKTVRKWVSIHFIPYLKVGRRVLFRPKSLELWLNQKENKSWL